MFDDLTDPQDSNSTRLLTPKPDAALQRFSKLRQYIKTGKTPWRRLSRWKRETLCNADILNPYDVGERGGAAFPLRENRFVRAIEYQNALKQRFLPEIKDAAIHRLKSNLPAYSAAKTLSTPQLIWFLLIACLLAACAVSRPIATLIAMNTVITTYFLLAIGFRIVLLAIGSGKIGREESPPIQADEELPVITILLPLLQDAEALPALIRAMDQLEYPEDKKDIKLLLEKDDTETLLEASRLNLAERCDLILIPKGGPRTKPKACNFGLYLARGDLIVIYDAEDQPEPDQLLKAARAFQTADPAVACMQARLNFYNHDECWLTRLFTLEYSLWFDWLLPALQKTGAPIPLGGTSNFFRTDVLSELIGWDPYNVTEDADLGLRMYAFGYRVEMLDSTTFEEANCRRKNWIRQRSRWMKGYLQTWLVHMRRPGAIIRSTGWVGFLSVQLFVAGNVLSALVNPILWLIFIAWLLTSSEAISAIFPEPLLFFNLFALIFGNTFFMGLAVIAPLKRGWFHLAPAGLSAPFYWLFASIAAYKAVWQLFFKPHYWEKTDHTISIAAKAKREEALKADRESRNRGLR